MFDVVKPKLKPNEELLGSSTAKHKTDRMALQDIMAPMPIVYDGSVGERLLLLTCLAPCLARQRNGLSCC